MTVIHEFNPHKSRRYQVEYRYGGTWNRPTGPGFRLRLVALVDALAWRSSGYASRVVDTASMDKQPGGSDV